MIALSHPRQCWICGGAVEYVQVGLSDHWRCLSCFAEAINDAGCGRSHRTPTDKAPLSLDSEALIRLHNQEQRRLRLHRQAAKRAASPPVEPKPIVPAGDAVAGAIGLSSITARLMDR